MWDPPGIADVNGGKFFDRRHRRMLFSSTSSDSMQIDVQDSGHPAKCPVPGPVAIYEVGRALRCHCRPPSWRMRMISASPLSLAWSKASRPSLSLMLKSAPAAISARTIRASPLRIA